MFKITLLLLLLVPVIELYVLIEVGSYIGTLTTVLLVFTTAFLGAYFMKSQGMAVMQRAQQNLAMGMLPQAEMLEGVFLFVGGVLLLIPGFVTDFLGLLLLLPWSRQLLAKRLLHNPAFRQYRRGASNDGTHQVYEAEWYQEVPDKQLGAHRQSDEQDPTSK